MKLTIVAATGGVGRQVLEQAFAAGHDVTAVVRNPAGLTRSVRAVVADLATPDPATLESAVAGADAVLSGLGPRSSAEHGIVSRGTAAIVAAMEATGVRRIVAVSVAGVGTIPTPGRPNPPKRDLGAGFFVRYVISPLANRVLGKHYADVAQMEDILRRSALDWTAVGLPVLTDKPPTGSFRTAYGQSVRRGLRISRADAAAFMLHAVNQPGTYGQSIAIAY
ncbi:NAD(P)-dependent oxidoreductase [Microlunatus parietis]|uniref:NAD(P)-dependent dehydrogenase (Short-subunit alcohol dehydrogenase family) n=1 Tax=Microlunatus parietis TaxID=682979 RepID=A0A7Y9LBW1_9ACTN|nr:NAD(P)H-binding protein [Microlunatus parietis]NYE70216.1 NAD(P)-dependent dehydrogenase (short-subunit alcohol dehydrogenase family) [Microlunatus parietis]